MRDEYNRAMLELKGDDLGGITSFALRLVEAGEWTDDIGRMLARMVVSFHGDDALTAYLDKVGSEILRRRPL